MQKINDIIEAAKAAGPRRIAVAAAQEHSALEAAVDAYEHGLAEPILVGDPDAIKALAKELKLDISRFEIVVEKEAAKAAAKAASQASGTKQGGSPSGSAKVGEKRTEVKQSAGT